MKKHFCEYLFPYEKQSLAIYKSRYNWMRFSQLKIIPSILLFLRRLEMRYKVHLFPLTLSSWLTGNCNLFCLHLSLKFLCLSPPPFLSSFFSSISCSLSPCLVSSSISFFFFFFFFPVCLSDQATRNRVFSWKFYQFCIVFDHLFLYSYW